MRERKDMERPIRGVDIGSRGVSQARLVDVPLLQQHLLLSLRKMEEVDGKDINKENYKFLVSMHSLLVRGLTSTLFRETYRVRCRPFSCLLFGQRNARPIKFTGCISNDAKLPRFVHYTGDEIMAYAPCVVCVKLNMRAFGTQPRLIRFALIIEGE